MKGGERGERDRETERGRDREEGREGDKILKSMSVVIRSFT